MLDTKHTIDFTTDRDIDFLYQQKNPHITNVLEELEIYNEIKNNNFNNT